MNAYLIVFIVVLILESAICTGLKYLHEELNGWPHYVPEENSDAKVETFSYC